jgi:WD40 repeat protein
MVYTWISELQDTAMNTPQSNMLFSDFIAYLHRQGFIIGVDHHLRLRLLLDKLGKNCKPTDLKFLLCPIFATNKKQQRQFYRAFDLYFKQLEPGIPGEPIFEDEQKIGPQEKKEKPVNTRKWAFISAGVFLVVVAASLLHLLMPSIEEIKVTGPGPTIGGGKEPGPKDPDPPLKSSVEEAREFVKKVDMLNEAEFELASREEEYKPTFYQRWGHTIRWLSILTPFIFFFLIEGFKRHRRRLLLEKQRGRKPPYIWPIKVETPEPILVKNEQFYQASRVLRQRLKSDVQRIDVDKTISSTIEKAGFPVFRYKAMTRPPEYLILIDLPAYRDHYAQLFDSIASALENEGLFVKRYFYENDPRVCFKEPDGERFYLTDFKTRFHDHRLIIFGDGEEFLDPVSGELDRWTALFHAWGERALLTPEPPKNWGRREVVLAREFIVLPASLNGLGAVKDHFEMHLKADLKSWKQADSQPQSPVIEDEIDTSALRDYLGEDTFQWLCACAVYPELHWDLTLFLGSLQCMPATLIREENVLRLIRLPWFRSGAMPDQLRRELIDKLDPDKNRAIRTAIVDLLEKNPAPARSAAYSTYRLHLVLQQWMLSGKDRKQRKALREALKTFPEKQVIQDYTLLQSRESLPGSRLNFLLPKRLRKIFYRKGVPLFGLKTGVRLTLTLFIAAIFYLVLKAPMPIEEPQRPVNLTLEHEAAVNGAAFSPDGKTILTGLDDGTVQLWDLRGNVLRELMGPAGSVDSMAFSPDGRTILTNTGDISAALWDLRGEGYVKLMGHAGTVTSMAFSSDGKMILTGSVDRTARLWDLMTRRELKVLKGHRNSVNSVAFSPDGKMILTGSVDKTARLWDLRGNVLRELMGHTYPVISAAFSLDGRTILTGSMDYTARLWDLMSGKELMVLKGHQGSVTSVAFSPDGRTILTGSRDYTARLWNVIDGSQKTKPIRHTGPINGVGFSRDGNMVLTWSQDGTAKLISIDPFLTDAKYNTPKYPELVALEGDGFIMGSPGDDKDGAPSERPQHRVTIAPFAMGKYEVTNAQFAAFLNEKGNQEENGGLWLNIDPGYTKIRTTKDDKFEVEEGYENYPVVGVSWYGANEYCQWLTVKADITFRLPTEAEWEYACRAGTESKYSFGDSTGGHEKYGWFRSNSGSGPHEVGQKFANNFGLYDMHGNMWEWCLDGWSRNYERTPWDGGAVRPEEDEKRVARGGAWNKPVKEARSANRNDVIPIPEINRMIGFRVVASSKDGYTGEKYEPSQDPSALSREQRMKVASDIYTRGEILSELANDRDPDVRRAVAGNRNTPISILDRLANDEDLDVRRAIAGNRSTPPEILEILARDMAYAVRIALAGNPNTPIWILKQLAKDANDDVRRAVADNPNTPVEIPEELETEEIKDFPVDQREQFNSLNEAIVSRGFLGILGREVDPHAKRSYVEFLETGGSVLQFCKALMDSDDYKNNRGYLPPDELARDFYRGILDREADPEGLAETIKMIEAGQGAERAAAMLNSQEFKDKFVKSSIQFE